MAIDGLRGDQAWLDQHANDDRNGNPIAPFVLGADVQTIADPPHDLGHIATQINTATHSAALPKMGGFVKSYQTVNPPDPRRVMGFYKAAAVPALNFLARSFVVCDRCFSCAAVFIARE